MLVDETVVRDEEPTVRRPVEVANLNSALEVAPPPRLPKRTCVSTHAVELGNAWVVKNTRHVVAPVFEIAVTALEAEHADAPPYALNSPAPLERTSAAPIPVSVICPVFTYPDAVMFVLDIFVIEEEPTVNAPVEDVNVINKLELAPPPKIPNRTCVSTPEEKLLPVEVLYLFPCVSQMRGDLM